MNDIASPRDDDIARLEALLDASAKPDAAPGADALQGMFAALAVGPSDVPVERWLPAILGAEDDAEVAADPELVEMLTRFRDEVAHEVRAGTFAPLLYELRRGRPDYTTWARGFLDGVALADVDWYDAADPDEVDELLFPLRVLAGELSEQERAAYSPAAWRKLLIECEAGLDAHLRRVRDYWNIVRSPPQTVRREMPKTGRNDPCPCASGRKYKQCCGKAGSGSV